MLIGKVVGNAWSSKKSEGLNGQSFFLVEPLKFGERFEQTPYVAADMVGAGVGDVVMISTGHAARIALGREDIPIDAAIVGIMDSIEVKDRYEY